MRRMGMQEKVVAYAAAHPNASATEIARALDCVPQYVFKVRARCGLSLPDGRGGDRVSHRISLPMAVRDGLAQAADARGQDISEIALACLRIIAADGLVDAILDDGGAA